jgi:hypothetical protein
MYRPELSTSRAPVGSAALGANAGVLFDELGTFPFAPSRAA